MPTERYLQQQKQHGERLAQQTPAAAIWRGERPRQAPSRTLYLLATGATVDYPVYVLDEANFERAEQAIALCLAHGLMAPA